MGDAKTMHLNLRLSAEEHGRLESARQRLQERLNKKAGTTTLRVSQKDTFLEALARLETYLTSLERDR